MRVLFDFFIDSAGSELCSKDEESRSAYFSRCCEFFENIFQQVFLRSAENAGYLYEVGDDCFIAFQVSACFRYFKSFFFEDALRQSFSCSFKQLIVFHGRENT